MTAPTAAREPDPGLAAAAEAAASPLDLLLTDAALGVLRRFLPSGSTLRLGMSLARRPGTVARASASLAGQLARIAAGRSPSPRAGGTAASPTRPGRQPGAAPGHAGLPRRRRHRRVAARRRAAGLARQRADAVRAEQPHRRGRAEQQPADQPARPGRRPSTPAGSARCAGCARSVRDMAAPPRVPAMIDAGRVRGGPGPRGHARSGRVPFGDLRADPVRAGNAAGPPVPAAHRPADDQQVLHHRPGPGPEHGRVPAGPGPPGLRHLLAEPRRPAPGLEPGQLRRGHRRCAGLAPLDLPACPRPACARCAPAASPRRWWPRTWPPPASSTSWPACAWA